MHEEIHLPKNMERKFKKIKIYEIENKKGFSKLEKEEINQYLTELVRILNKK